MGALFGTCRKLREELPLSVSLSLSFLFPTNFSPTLSSQLMFSLFFKKEMELSLIGLQNAGKTSLVNVIATGGFDEDMIPTVSSFSPLYTHTTHVLCCYEFSLLETSIFLLFPGDFSLTERI